MKILSPNGIAHLEKKRENSISKSKNFRSPRTGTPGLSRGLLAGLLAHSVRLALVLGHTNVNLPVEEIFVSISTSK